MSKKCVKIYTPSTLGQPLETKSFSPSALPTDEIALAINEDISTLFSIFNLSPLEKGVFPIFLR